MYLTILCIYFSVHIFHMLLRGAQSSKIDFVTFALAYKLCIQVYCMTSCYHEKKSRETHAWRWLLICCAMVYRVLLGMLGVIKFFLAEQVAWKHRKHIIISKLSHYEYTHLCNEILMILYMI